MNELEENPLVLVVDDDAMVRFMAREALEPAGFKVEEAADGVAAVAVVDGLRPDIILMDVMMPNMDGFTACSKIRATVAGRHIPILMATGLDDTESINRAYEAGATDFTTKPLNYPLLQHRIRYMLRAKDTADELRAREAQLANAQRIARLCHWDWDLNLDQVRWSKELKAILKLPSLSVVESYKGFLERVPGDDKQALIDAVTTARKDKSGYRIEHEMVCDDGSLITVHQEAEFVVDESSGGFRLIGTLQDITERRRAEKQIEQLAYYDTVTGLPNRVMLERELQRQVERAKEHGASLAVMTLDLDHFKPINDTFGHSKGNHVLRKISERLGACIERRKQDMGKTVNALLAHFGADEFIILLTDISGAEDVLVAAERIRTAVARPIVIDDNEICLSGSIGISVFPEDGDNADTLLKNSGAALYNAKKEGKNRNMFFKSSMNATAFERLSMEAGLRKAFEERQFALHYQPKVAIADGRVVGMEALLRWCRPDGEMVPPNKFIPIAEDTGLIVELGEFIFQTTCNQIVAWREQGLPELRAAVNLSPVQFGQKDLDGQLARWLKDSGVPSRCLELEITESMLMTNAESAIKMMNKLKALGLEISIDDFGTGYSSLSYLKRLPINTLKIDQSFIRDVTNGGDDAAIVMAVIAMAHSLRLKVIAEGVENENQLSFLEDHGCDEVQGYYYSRPLPPDQFADWVLKHQAAAVA